MRKTIIFGGLFLAAAAVAWWFASPWWTLHQIREAAAAKDSARLSAYVDYPALREDLKGDLRRAMLEQSARDPAGAGGQLGSAMALAMLGPMIDAMVSPDGVQAMISRQTKAGAAANTKASDSLVVERDGLNRFKVYEKTPGKGAMVFERSGLGWKLSGVDLQRS